MKDKQANAKTKSFQIRQHKSKYVVETKRFIISFKKGEHVKAEIDEVKGNKDYGQEKMNWFLIPIYYIV